MLIDTIFEMKQTELIECWFKTEGSKKDDN